MGAEGAAIDTGPFLSDEDRQQLRSRLYLREPDLEDRLPSVMLGGFVGFLLTGSFLEGQGHPLIWAIVGGIVALGVWNQRNTAKRALRTAEVNGLPDAELVERAGYSSERWRPAT